MKYGLIGEHLGYSYSKIIHESLGYSYQLNELTPVDIPKFFEDRNFKGINVTIPYKKIVMEYCDEISDLANKIGAVNTIYFNGEKMIGTNTDFAGFVYMCQRAGIDVTGKNILILGTGGASAMVKFAAEVMGADKIYIATRNKNIDAINKSQSSENDEGKLTNITLVDYNELPSDIEILINTTPVGTYPNIYDAPIDLSHFGQLYAVLDLIYNPLKTSLLMQAEKRGIINSGGLSMLVAQAVMASHLFNSGDYERYYQSQDINHIRSKDENVNVVNSFNDSNNLLSHYYEMNIETETLISNVLEQLTQKIKNIVLIGMPSCGKSSIGMEISKKTLRKFVDTDTIISKRYGKTPEEIITTNGEKYFRMLEKQVIKDVSKEHSTVIATGGGSILDKENLFSLKQNGDIYFIDRNINLLTDIGRPLSRGKGKLAELYKTRLPIYKTYADYIIENDNSISQTAKRILDIHYTHLV